MFLSGQNVLSDHPLFRDSAAGKSLQEMPLGFIDIGARGGAHDIVEPIAKQTAVLGFEPDEEECQRLMRMPEVYQPWGRFLLKSVALADKKGTASLKLLSSNTNHSLLSPNNALTKRYNMVKWEEVGQCSLETDTLDAVLLDESMKNQRWAEFLKIDTQGTEYEILEGSFKTLSAETVAVVAEVAFCELYQHQKLFSDVETLMRKQGFSFYGFTTLHTRSKKYLDKRSSATRERLIYTDAVFFKDPLPGGYTAEFNDRMAYTLFTVSLLLGFYDYALELANGTWLQKSNDEEKDRINELVQWCARKDPVQALKDINQLAVIANEKPELSNVIVGGFVDRRRFYCDYDDVLNISPLPKTL